MKGQYFHRIAKHSPTQFWINNPTREQADLAINAGATGCTNNPSYVQKMLDNPAEGGYTRRLLDETLKTSKDASDVQTILQRKMVAVIAEKFLTLFSQTHGTDGYVSIQGNPLQEKDPDIIVKDALENRKLGKNVCCKIPVTEAGLKAMEELIPMGVPLNATEVMSVSQVIELCERYEKAAAKSGTYPMLYLSHIAGIFDEYLKMTVHRENIVIDDDILWQAGLTVARKIYRIMRERGYRAVFVAGGARDLHHFTEMVGAEACVTINWQGTADILLERDYPAVHRFFNQVPYTVIDELSAKLPDFKKAYSADGLALEEFEEFGPVVLFRSMFIKSWERVLRFIDEKGKE